MRWRPRFPNRPRRSNEATKYRAGKPRLAATARPATVRSARRNLVKPPVPRAAATRRILRSINNQDPKESIR
jgi:hypothetical protein